MGMYKDRDRGPVRIRVIHRARQAAIIVAMAATDVLNEILRLPAEERARLALELIRSLDGEGDADATAAWDAEIERRGAEVEAGSAVTLSLDEYRAHVRARKIARARR